MKKSQIVRRWGWLIAMMGLLAPVGFAQQANPEGAPPAATDAYAAMSQADEARDNEDWAGAISGYRDALGLYRRLAASRPDWEPETVRYRISYCATQIEKIGRTTGQSAAELVTNSMSPQVSAAPESDVENLRERYSALMQENEYLRKRQMEMEGEITGSPAAPEAHGEIEKLKAENAELQKKLAAAPAAADSTQAHELAARANQLGEQCVALTAENEALKQQLEKAMADAAVAAAGFTRPPEVQNVLQRMHEGLAQERNGNYADARAIYDPILLARPSYAEAFKAKGRCLLQERNFDEAVAALRAAVCVNPNDPQARLLLGTAYGLAEKYQSAVDVLTPLVAEDPSNARAQSAIGAAWAGLGDTRSAKAALEKALALDPELADAHFNLAQVLQASGPANMEKARLHYRNAVTLGSPADEELAKKLGLP